MKANELRIGNYIKYTYALSNDIEFCKVTGVKNDGRVYFFLPERYKTSLDANEIDPIELTEEVLIKIGFEKIELVEKKLYMYYKEVRIDNYSYLLDFRVMPKDECIVLYVMKNEDAKVDYFTIFYNDNIKYLHQLQNAYYLLTNKELEVEL